MRAFRLRITLAVVLAVCYFYASLFSIGSLLVSRSQDIQFVPGLTGILEIDATEFEVIDQELAGEPRLWGERRPLFEEHLDEISVQCFALGTSRFVPTLVGRIRFSRAGGLAPLDELVIADAVDSQTPGAMRGGICRFGIPGIWYPNVGFRDQAPDFIQHKFRLALRGDPRWYPLDAYRLLLSAEFMGGKRPHPELLGLSDFRVTVSSKVRGFVFVAPHRLLRVRGDKTDHYFLPMEFAREPITRLSLLLPLLLGALLLILAVGNLRVLRGGVAIHLAISVALLFFETPLTSMDSPLGDFWKLAMVISVLLLVTVAVLPYVLQRPHGRGKQRPRGKKHQFRPFE